MKKFTYNTPIGKLFIGEYQKKIAYITFTNSFDGEEIETPLIKQTHIQLCEYFNKERKIFDIPLYISGTDFQMKVWKALCNISYGKTKTYGEIAKIISQPAASRAVGGANNKNKIAIIIPCHRVIGKNNNLTGYAGGLNIKKYLLDLENPDNNFH